MNSARLPYAFYARGARVVARALLGKRLVHLWEGQRLAGVITETEAYCDSVEPDLACHGSKNKGRPTARTAVMFGSAGHVYMYLNYGIHWMFNVVTGQPDQANAVLIRAVEPIEGVAVIQTNRANQPRPLWADGPGKLTQALNLDKSLNGMNLCDPNGVIWIEDAPPVPELSIQVGPRIGLGKTPEPWFSIPWRYWIRS
ncbi:MAG: DNA-3-methyladenine glycosylase [Anaerolineales bacterium]|nr:DNA-3-methyladenine glycosylase [Anaerolineales bacterium]